jgi:EAL domain-containing protein (putative c-di-GMP-specific phosphodiesterase class I)
VKYGIDYAQGYFIGKPTAYPEMPTVAPLAKQASRAS